MCVSTWINITFQCKNAELEAILNGTVKEGCQLYGYLEVAKVAGKFYFAPSKIFKSGYLLANDLLDTTFEIFDNSHKINVLRFGEEYPVRILSCLNRLYIDIDTPLKHLRLVVFGEII